MKKVIKNLVVVLAVAGMVSCNSNKKATIKDDGTEVVKVRTPEATPESDEEKEATISVEGKVSEINKGKDGYTAILTAEDGKIYYATISIPNLKDPKQYRSFKIGENIKISGDLWKMEDDNYITVRKLF